MLVASFTELFLQARKSPFTVDPVFLLHGRVSYSLSFCSSPLSALFYRILRQLVNETRKTIGEKRGHDMSHIKDTVPVGSVDPAPPSEQVANRTWMIGATISVVLTMILGKTQVRS